MLRYNLKARRLYSRFFRYRNDIDIYTEDEEKDNEFYRKLFSRLLKDTGLQIHDVTPLGCKQNVIDRCKEEPRTERKKIFIVDGDIDLIFDNKETGIDNLFVLNAYCIENLIIDEKSATEFLYMNVATDSKKNIQRTLNFDKWLSCNSTALIDLFLNFSISREIGQYFLIYNANRFTKKQGKESILDIEAVEQYTDDVKTKILKEISEDEYNRLITERRRKWPVSNETFLTIVSGKDYLLPLFQFRVQKFKSIKGLFSLEAIKLILAVHCELTRLEPLKQEMIK